MMDIFKKIGGKSSIIILALILIISATLMLSVSKQESAIMDELAHIPAGYGYVSQFDYRLNPEHPPIVKALAEIPLLFMGVNFPTDIKVWKDDINGQWTMGTNFLYKVNGQQADSIIFISRLFPILLTLLLTIFVFVWTKELIGKNWALIAAFFTALSPNILTHGHYVTTDIGAAFGFFASMYFFCKYLQNATNKNLIWAGLFFGLAQLLKFSTVLLIPLFLFFVVVYWWAKSHELNLGLFRKQSLQLLAKNVWGLIKIFIIGFLLVWFIYFIFTLNYPIQRQLSDTQSILGSYGGSEKTLSQSCLPPSSKCLAQITIWMSDKPIIRGFSEYMLGVLMVMQRSAGGNMAYFMGNLGGGGWWYYFPTVFLLKEPVPSLILIFLGLILALSRIFKKTSEKIISRLSNYILLNFSEFSMICLVVFYWLYSMKSPLNIGYRHILLTVPFMYILSVGSIRKWFHFEKIQNLGIISSIGKVFSVVVKTSIKGIIVTLLLIWLAIEVASAYPYYLSYFNQFGGGIWNGYKYVTDSNYDWGQDLKRLETFTKENNIEKIAVDYFGGGDVEYYLGKKYISWRSSDGNPLKSGVDWIAISINSLMGAKGNLQPGFVRKSQDSYEWLKNWEEPYARAGTSIFIYKLN